MKRKEGAFWVAQAAIFVAVLVLISLPGQLGGSASSSSSSSETTQKPLVFVSPVSQQGLQLDVSLSSTAVPLHGAVSAHVEVVNTLNRNVTLSGFGQNRDVDQWGRSYMLCGTPLVVGFGLFKGRVTAVNLSASGRPLQLIPPLPPAACPFPLPFTSATFLPGGDQATFGYSSGPVSPAVPARLNVTTYYCEDGLSVCGQTKGLLGYWNASIPNRGDFSLASPAFVYFQPGEYTVVGVDDWNQTVFAHFEIRAGPSASLAAACFVSIPAGSQMGDFANQTFNGENVTFPNGTALLFSNYSCPRPVFGGSNQGANLTELAVAAVTNKTFASTENGSTFLFQQPSGLSCSTVGSEKCSMTLYFYHYGANGTLFRCGGGLDPNNAGMLYRRDALAGLTVTFYTTGPATNNGVNSATSWDLQHPVVQLMSQDQLMTTYDNSYPCG